MLDQLLPCFGRLLKACWSQSRCAIGISKYTTVLQCHGLNSDDKHPFRFRMMDASRTTRVEHDDEDTATRANAIQLLPGRCCCCCCCRLRRSTAPRLAAAYVVELRERASLPAGAGDLEAGRPAVAPHRDWAEETTETDGPSVCPAIPGRILSPLHSLGPSRKGLQ